MLTLDRIEPQTVAVFGPDGTCLGYANEYELSDLRIRIRRSGSAGYAVEYNGERIPITKEGRLTSCPSGLFDLSISQSYQLVCE